MHTMLLLALAVLLGACAGAATEDEAAGLGAEPGTRLYFLKQDDSGVVLEPFYLQPGESREFKVGSDTGYVAPVIWSQGATTGIRQAWNEPTSWTIEHKGDRITAVRASFPDMVFEQPVVASDEADLRVSVTRGNERQAFLILPDGSRRPDRLAPPLVLRLDPRAAFIVAVERLEPFSRDYVFGEVSILQAEEHLYVQAEADGRELTLLIDTGASESFVFEPSLSEGVRRVPSTRKHAYRGLSGEIAHEADKAVFGELSLGTISFKDARFSILPQAIEATPRRIDGVLGLDLLCRTPRLTISPTRGGGHMKFTADRLSSPSVRSAMGRTATALYIPGKLDGKEIFFFMDTGAKYSVMDPAAAANYRLPRGPEGPIIWGGDGKEVQTLETRISGLEVGGVLMNVLMPVAPIGIFRENGIHDNTILFGGMFFCSLQEFEFDFENMTFSAR